MYLVDSFDKNIKQMTCNKMLSLSLSESVLKKIWVCYFLIHKTYDCIKTLFKFLYVFF